SVVRGHARPTRRRTAALTEAIGIIAVDEAVGIVVDAVVADLRWRLLTLALGVTDLVRPAAEDWVRGVRAIRIGGAAVAVAVLLRGELVVRGWVARPGERCAAGLAKTIRIRAIRVAVAVVVDGVVADFGAERAALATAAAARAAAANGRAARRRRCARRRGAG